MARTVVIDPLTRIEGHLAVELETEANRVVGARCSGEMFRGFEVVLVGRHPMDAQQLTQRICGVCPISHGTASVFAQEAAYGVAPPPAGRVVRNLILGANFLQSHILHFYHLSALDFVDVGAVASYRGSDPVLGQLKSWIEAQAASKSLYPAAPFLPHWDVKADTEFSRTALRHYVEALELRAVCHKMAAIFCGKIPHSTTLVPGGVTERITVEKLEAYRSLLRRVAAFVKGAYLPDVLAAAAAFPDYFQLGRRPESFLSYGAFPESDHPGSAYLPAGALLEGQLAPFDPARITEDVGHSLYASPSGLHPSQGRTDPAPDKHRAYSWVKAPRYGGQAMEVGPLARLLVAYRSGRVPEVTRELDAALKAVGRPASDLPSAMGRHLARAVEAKLVAERCAGWLDQLRPDEPAVRDFRLPRQGSGAGFVEAPRGALGHWLRIERGVIATYQCVVPTTWNCSPRDDRGAPGPVEEALVGTSLADPGSPIEAARVVRSFDPCLACAVH